MNKRLLLLSCTVVLLAFGLSACGGGGGDEASEVEDVIETSAVTTDPADCKKLETQQFMEQLSQLKGPPAVKQCEVEAESGAGAKSVSVSNVVIGGSSASAELAVEGGGGFDGQTVEIALVKEGDQWKVDKLVSFTKLDQDRLVEVFREEFAKPSNKLSPKLVGCFLEVFEKGSQDEVEELLLSGSTKAFEEVAESCK